MAIKSNGVLFGGKEKGGILQCKNELVDKGFILKIKFTGGNLMLQVSLVVLKERAIFLIVTSVLYRTRNRTLET